jgi:type VI secretion system protein ImpF
MATKEQRPAQQSILDRLIDLDPHTHVEAPLTRAQSVRALKSGLRRDLEWLLNTRRTVHSAEGFTELHSSAFTFGIPDITSIRLHSGQDQEQLLREVERAIQVFEPRLANVRVSSVEPFNKNGQELHFHIEGLLLLDPAPELIAFDTTLDLSRGDYQVSS